MSHSFPCDLITKVSRYLESVLNAPDAALETVNPSRSAAIYLMYLTRLDTYDSGRTEGVVGDGRSRKGGPGAPRPLVSSEFMMREDAWSLSPRGRCTGRTRSMGVWGKHFTATWLGDDRSPMKTFNVTTDTRTAKTLPPVINCFQCSAHHAVQAYS